MQRLEAAGYQIVLHVHDEIVAEAPIEFGSVEEFTRLITALPDWAEGLPVAAKVRNGQRFSKSEKLTGDIEVSPRGFSAILSTNSTTPPWEDRMAQEQPAPDDIEIVDMPGINIDAIKAQFRGCGGDSGAANAGT